MDQESFQVRQKQPIGIDKLMELDLSTLTEEMDRLQDSIQRLVTSNAEMLEFENQEEDFESRKDFQQAREENVETITCQKERVEMIKWTIQKKLGRPAGTKSSHYGHNHESRISRDVPKLAHEQTSDAQDSRGADQGVESDSANGISL